jgi:hypothetical protein
MLAGLLRAPRMSVHEIRIVVKKHGDTFGVTGGLQIEGAASATDMENIRITLVVYGTRNTRGTASERAVIGAVV